MRHLSSQVHRRDHCYMQGKGKLKSIRIRCKGMKMTSHPHCWPLDYFVGEMSMAMDPVASAQTPAKSTLRSVSPGLTGEHLYGDISGHTSSRLEEQRHPQGKTTAPPSPCIPAHPSPCPRHTGDLLSHTEQFL